MQQSNVQRYCESVIEAGWLAALIVTPLFFNPYSRRVFEPDKISLVRTISLVMLLAYLVKLIDGGRFWLPAGGGATASSAPRPEEGGRPTSPGGWRLPRLWRRPLLLPIVLLGASYALSTVFSISPYVSWWGSYHRQQGAYTFISYLIIALLTAAHLRQPIQMRRLQHTIILTSLPISIYGALQHFGRDPLPWGEDLTTRIAANAGNAIFLAAYLILAFFLTFERVFSRALHQWQGESQPTGEPESVQNRANLPPGHDLAGALAFSAYLLALMLQLLAILWTQSRGPWLGLASGIYIFVLLSLAGMRLRNYRRWTAVWVGLGAAAAILLILLNTTALGRPFRQATVWGRLTTMLDSGSGTGRVRALIWEGVSQMVSPHEPLAFPDGTEDALNPLRPLIGYGPETMWLAFNRFYLPELAQWEARDRNPDRSHNETWDSLAITGILGFLANSFLFLSIFFWSLRWLGLIRSRRDGALFFSLSVGGGLSLSLFFLARGAGAGFLGVNWPTGLILGLVVYVTLAAFLQPESGARPAERRRQFLIAAILSAIVAHYVEIHFGIAIAATRIYFWIFVATLLALGMRWLVPTPRAAEEAATERGLGGGENAAPARAARSKSGRCRRGSETGGRGRIGAVPTTVAPDLLILFTLTFIYTSNGQGLSNPLSILFSNLVTPGADQASGSGSALLWLMLFTWGGAALMGGSAALLRRVGVGAARSPGPTATSAKRAHHAPEQGRIAGRIAQALLAWAQSAGLYGLLLFAGWLLYGLIFAGRLLPVDPGRGVAESLDRIAGLFSMYVWTVVLWCLCAGLVLAWGSLAKSRRAWTRRPLAAAGGAILLSPIVFLIISNVNIAPARADIFYKQGNVFESGGRWVESADLYRRALAVRPTEDYYMLYLGRSLLFIVADAPEKGSRRLPPELSLQDALGLTAEEIEQLGSEELLRIAEIVLKRAQEVNPLNTDHTANLARLYLHWSKLRADPPLRTRALQTSLRYYEAALRLSPYAARLWNEKGRILVYLGQMDEAEETYLRSLAIDDRFERTYVLLAQLYAQTGELEKYSDEKYSDIVERGLEKLPNSLPLLSHLGVARSRAGDMDGALAANLQIVERAPYNFDAVRNLVILYWNLDRLEEANRWADRAVDLIKDGRAGAGADIHIYDVLVELYLENGRLRESVDLLRRMIALAPDDFRHPLRLAQVYKDLGNALAALQFGESALTLAPDSGKPGIQAFINSLD